MNAGNLLALALLLSAAPGCATKIYSLKAEEIRRVAEALGTEDEVVAAAMDENNEPVRIRVKASDRLRVWASGEAVYEVDARDASCATPRAELTLEQSHTGTGLLFAGLALFVGGWGLSVYPVASEPEWLEHPAVSLIPLAGPIYTASDAGLHRAFGSDGSGGSSSAVLATSVIASIAQIVGLGLFTGGALLGGWDREVSPEADREGGGAGISWGFEPVVTPDGEVGGVLTGRF